MVKQVVTNVQATAAAEASAPAAIPPPGVGGYKAWGFLQLALTVAVVALVVITLPRLPLGSDDDSSWGAVLGYAHQQGLQFGTELAFTYGPLGFLVTPYQCPQAPELRLAADIGISLACAAGLCLAAWRLGRFWRWFVIGTFVLLAGNADPRSELLLNVGLLSWVFLCLDSSGRSSAGTTAVLTGLSVFAVLCKVTFLFIAPLGLAVVGLDFVLRGRRTLALLVWAGFAAGLVAAWVGLGQQLSHLPAFLGQALTFSTGYAGAMQAKGFSALTWTALAIALIALPAAGLGASSCLGRTRGGNFGRRAAFGLWLLAWIFLLWKHGFVRADRDHVEVFFGCAPVLVLLVQLLPGAAPAVRRWIRVSGVACSLLSLFALQWLFAGDFVSCLTRPFKLGAAHVHTLVHPRIAAAHQREQQAAEIAAMQLPRLRARIGRGSVDVFGCNQAYAVFNGLNYQPRPVFQSYAAYSELLMRLNEGFYFSAAAPRYVLFRLNPIDERFPPLEDALLFRDLLVNYTPVDAEGPFLLLQFRQSNFPRLQLLLEGQLRPGQPLDLSAFPGADLWLELELQPSVAGRAVGGLYQTPPVELGVWCRSRTGLRLAKFRSPASMLAAGFVASPLLLDNQDVLDLYTSGQIIRPVGYSVELPSGTRADWQNTIPFRLFQIQDPLGRSAPRELSRLLKYPGFELAPAAIVSPTNAVLQIRGRLALYLPPGSYMRFVVPATAKVVKGSFGFAPGAYALGGATAGAEFRIEEEMPDGRMELLQSRILRPVSNPGDRGLQDFVFECPGEGRREILFRILPLAGEPSRFDLTCWADIGFQ